MMVNRRDLMVGAASAALGSTMFAGTVHAQRRRAGAAERKTFERFLAPGPFSVKTANPLSFKVPDQNKDLLVRVSYPDPATPSDGRKFPVVLFSHGALSSKDEYDPVTEHWGSHGYVSIQPTHLDSESLGFKFGAMDQGQLVQSRIGDMKFLLDRLPEIGAQSPALVNRLDTGKIAAAGHSFGALIALALAGLPLKGPNGQLMRMGDPRIKALVTYNGVGPLPYLAEDWSDVTVPTFAASGTNDPGATGDGILRPWRWRMGAYDLTSGKDRYAVSIASGDHYFGGLICRPGAGGQPDPDGLAIVNALSTAFLAAEFEGDKAARALLRAADLAALTNQRGFLESA